MAALLARNKLPFAATAGAVRPTASRVRMVVRAQAQQPNLATLAKPAATVAVANLIMAMPAAAEAGKLFDFNLTLPVVAPMVPQGLSAAAHAVQMAGQFLLLMVFLDKAWFTPVGKVLDERDALIRQRLSSVKENSGDVDKFAVEAQSILKAARAEVTSLVNSQKQAKQAELDKQYNEAKAKIGKEMDAAVAALEAESQVMLNRLDSQVEKISNDVLRRVLPESVRI